MDFQLQTSTLFKNASYINGQWHVSNQQFDVFDPYNREHLAACYVATEQQTLLAIDSAQQAQQHWAQIPHHQRASLLTRWAELIRENKQELATLLTLEQGKPINEALAEIDYGASYIDYYAQMATRIDGDIIAPPSPDKRILVQKYPVGVVAAITPWNFPNAMITRKAAAALAAGCSFIVKPSELTPLSATALAELADRAQIPAGLFNVIISDDAKPIGDHFCTHPQVAKLTFTGSTKVGQLLAEKASKHVKRLSLELGGNAPFIVFDDADINAAIEGLIAAKFRNSGQTCVCANRILVASTIHDEFVSRLTHRVKQFSVDHGLAGATLAAMINKSAINKAQHLVDSALEQGAKKYYSAQPHSSAYPVTILTDVTNEMTIAQTEQFAPIVAIIKFSSEQEAVSLANDTESGLAAYFYTNDVKRIWRLGDQLEFGMLGINEGAISNAAAPFGGIKQSGYGREGSKYGLDDYLATKYLCLGGLA